MLKGQYFCYLLPNFSIACNLNGIATAAAASSSSTAEAKQPLQKGTDTIFTAFNLTVQCLKSYVDCYDSIRLQEEESSKVHTGDCYLGPMLGGTGNDNGEVVFSLAERIVSAVKRLLEVLVVDLFIAGNYIVQNANQSTSNSSQEDLDLSNVTWYAN